MSKSETLAATALLVCLAAQALHFAWSKSATYDESEHVVAGHYALTLGDFDVDHQHPPLARMWCALPLINLRNLRLPTDQAGAHETPRLFWGPIFMWEANRDGALLTWLTRLPMVALTVIMASVVYGWARSLYGRRAALVALFLCAFSPAVLASGALATTDLPAAAFSVLSGYAAWLWLKRPSLERGIAAGAAVGMAWASKLSTIFLAPAFAVLVGIWWLTEGDRLVPKEIGPWARFGQGVAGVFVAVISLCVLPVAAVVSLAIGFWLAWLAHRWRSSGGRAGLTSLARTLPAAILAAIIGVALSHALVWAAGILPLGVVAFEARDKVLVACGSFAAGWLALRHTGLLRLLAALHWASFGRWAARSAALLVTAFTVLWACYGFDLRPRQGNDTVPWLRLKRLPGALPRVAAAALWAANDQPLPLRAYWSGLELVRRLHEGSGHGCRMVGRARGLPPWSYFPLVIATKTPCALLLLVAVSSLLALHPSHWPRRDELPLLIPPLVYLGIVLQSHMTVGVRHLLPLYVFAFIWASRLVRRGRGSRVLAPVVIALLAWGAGSVLHAGPHFLAYFNEFAGGVTRGAEWFRDSNVDWGQDLRLLARYQARHPEVNPLGLAYFGTADPRGYGVRGRRISLDEPWPGYVAVSATLLRDDSPTQAWLRARPVAAYIGGSIRVYGPSP